MPSLTITSMIYIRKLNDIVYTCNFVLCMRSTPRGPLADHQVGVREHPPAVPAVVEAEFLLFGEPEALHEPGVRALELRQPLAREREPPAEIAPTDLGRDLGKRLRPKELVWRYSNLSVHP